MNATPPENPQERSKLWTIFWLTQMTAMALPFVMAAIVPKNTPSAAIVGWAGAAIGAVACGILLAKLTSKTSASRTGRAVAFSFLFMVAFAICAFAGCVVMVLK